MIRRPSPLLRTLAGLALAFSLAPASEQAGQDGQAPKTATDDPPLGTGRLRLLEDFELTAPGQVPHGYTQTGAVSVVDDVAHSGRHSLRLDAAPNGPRRITMKGEILKALGGQHWGRLYFKVKLPAPEPAGGVIHSTLVGGTAQSPLHKDPIEVRVLDTVMNSKGMHQYLYNVQPSKRGEFGKGSSYQYKFTDEWTRAEWYVESATQSYRLFIKGEEAKDVAFTKGAGNFADSEIPDVFESLSFGWNNYQTAGKGFVAWIDDIALAKDRIGSRGLPPVKPAKKP